MAKTGFFNSANGYNYFTRMRKTHNFRQSLDIVHVFRLLMINFAPIITRFAAIGIVSDCQNCRPHYKQWCWAAVFPLLE